MMKTNEMPKLKLNKRTIANLNNMEMRYVVGGGGDDLVNASEMSFSETWLRSI